MTINQLLPIARTVTWISYIGLWVTLLANGLYKSAPVLVHLITLAPLLIFVPGMLKQSHKTLSMLCFVCLMYFTVITVNLFEPNRNGFDIAEMVWVVILFTSAMMFSRWKQRILYQHHVDSSETSSEN